MTTRADPVGHDELADQLMTLIRTRLLDPLEILLGDSDEAQRLSVHVHGMTDRWAEDLRGDDDAAAVATVMRLVAALYPGDGPFDPSAEWWATPLGQAVLRRAGHPPAPRFVSYSIAGAMLGMTKQGVHDLVRRNKLDRDPDGGVSTHSVRERLLQIRPVPAQPTTEARS